MPIRPLPPTGLLFPAMLAMALAAWPAAAQQATPTPPPPTPNQPNSEAAGKLRGINPPPFPMAADKLPVPQLKAPKGFKYDRRCRWGCGGGVMYPMRFCPWCGRPEKWRYEA